MEFASSLSFLPAESYHSVQRLTRIYNRIRFGARQIQPESRRRLDKVVDRIDQQLDTARP